MNGPSEPESIGVVVVAGGREAHLRRVLDGLGAQTRAADEIVVVTLGSPTPADVAAHLPVTSVCLPKQGDRLPLGAARNLGAATLTTASVAFLDVDCIPHPDLVRDYLDGLAAHAEALACGRVRYLREAWARRPQTGIAALEAASDHHPSRPRPDRATIDRVHHELFWSLNFAVRRTVWARLGGFDEAFVGYGAEDTDLGLRARQGGIPLLWLPGAVAYHQWHPPTRLDPRRLHEMVDNAHTYRRRWGSWPMLGWLRELQAAGAVRFDPAAGLLEVRA